MKFFSLIIFFCSLQVFAVPAFKNCTQDEVNSLFDHTEDAKSRVLQWQNRLDSYKDLNMIHKTKISIGKGILSCIHKKLDRIKYKCDAMNSHRLSAQTFYVLFKSVRLNYDFFYSDSDTITGVLIHEASHKCGTTDALYFKGGIRARSTVLVPWPLIGDTYQYWATDGFCLPDHDC